MAKSVIVTVRYKEFAQDMELPVMTSIEELCEKLLETLKSENGSVFNALEKILLLHDGFCLADRAATLEEYGIRTGDYLDIVRGA